MANDLRQAENRVRIEGILSEIDLELSSFVKNGKTNECIKGSIKVLVNQVINGVETTNEIPVHMFANKLKNDGQPNPAYESILKIKNEYVSIAAAGGEADADRIRITGAQIKMNEYYNPAGQLVSFPRINASFVSKIKKEDCKPEATFSVEMVVATQGYKTDADGVEIEPKIYNVKGIIPGYANSVDVVDFICSNENVVAAVSNYWEEGATVKASGRLNFTSTTETYMETQGFGESIERTRTKTVSELVITGGSPEPLDGDFAYNSEDIAKALADRKNKLAEQKEKSSKPKTSNVSAPAKGSAGFDLGF